MTEQEMLRLENLLRQSVTDMTYPPTPQIAAAVMTHLPKTRRTSQRIRVIQGVTATILIVIAGIAAVPEARAALLEIIRLGSVSIFPAPSEMTLAPVTATPSATATTLTELAVLTPVIDGKTTLEAARRAFGLPILLPADRREPDEVYTQFYGGWVVILIWRDAAGEIEMALHLLSPDVSALKFQPPVVHETVVNGSPAVWTEGEYPIVFKENGHQDYSFARLVEGHVLIWTLDKVTYRLESDLTLAQAIEIAESIIP